MAKGAFHSSNGLVVGGRQIDATLIDMTVIELSLDMRQYIHNTGYMETTLAIEAFAALSQSTRLDAFRLIMKHEPDGLPAGEVARLLDVPQNTMSSHLAVLARAGLLTSERHSRSIVYRAEIDKVRELASYLVTDCCGGRPELCVPLVAEFTPCCAREGTNAL